jgi:hypothetical protein
MRGKTVTTGMTIALALVLVLGVLAPVSQSSVDTGSTPEPRAIFQIFDVDDLQDMQNHLDDDSILMNDIDATITSTWNGGEGFVPIGAFATPFLGSLDGQNHTINGLYINRNTDFVGLIGYMRTGSSVMDLSLSGVEINGNRQVGGFVGWNDYGIITNCSSTGDVSGTGHQVGGFVGRNNGGTFMNCSSTGDVSGEDHVGGFVGYNDGGTITNCYSTGNASGGTEDQVGGFVGLNWGVTAIITNCSSIGDANGFSYSGGFTGRNWGGIITNSYCTGNASGLVNVGGFAGVNAVTGTITNCYSIGNASGAGDVGGFVGWNNGGTITDCFWDTETSGWATSDGGTGKTTVEMMQQATFTNWDFTTIWGIIEDYTYPFFQPLELLLPLSEGWNLLSLPVTQSSENLNDILESIDGKWDCIQTYDPLSPEPWKTNATFRPDQLNDFNTLNHKQGFWINITEPDVNLTVIGYILISTSVNLSAGWNLVGYPSLVEKSISDALSGTGYDAVEGFNATAPYRISPLIGTYMMKPGEGYWVHVPFDTTWIINW